MQSAIDLVNPQSADDTRRLELPLKADRADQVRDFVRNAAQAEHADASCADRIAADCAQVWLALCDMALCDLAQGTAVCITVSSSPRDITASVQLPGPSRFSELVPTISQRLQPDAGLSGQPTGADNWEVRVHRSLPAAAVAPALAHAASDTNAAPAAPHDLAVELPVQGDAESISQCFRAVYGHNYVHSEVFSPSRYWLKVDSGEVIPVVVRDDKGAVVGHLALERDIGAVVAERGEAVVLPTFRGHHLLERMTERLSIEAPKRGLHGIYAEPLTIHTISQRNDELAGMPVCAVLLGANPESYRPKDMACPTAGQRQSYLRTFRFVQRPDARAIHAPAPYRDMLLGIYESLGVTVTQAPSAEVPSGPSRIGVHVNDRGYGVIRFERIGANVAAELQQAFEDVRLLGASSVQLCARASDPGLPAMTDAARGLGFFFCGLAPAFANGEDLFLLQWLGEKLDTSKLQLFTDRAKDMVAFIDRDRAA